MSACEHPRQLHVQTSACTQDGWTPSTLRKWCLDCDWTRIITNAAAFCIESVRRSSKIVRDDRTDAERSNR